MTNIVYELTLGEKIQPNQIFVILSNKSKTLLLIILMKTKQWARMWKKWRNTISCKRVTHEWKWNVKMNMTKKHDTKCPAVCGLTLLSARLVVWCFICTSGLSTEQIYWLRLFRLCFFVFRRNSSCVSINYKKRSKRKEERQSEKTPQCSHDNAYLQKYWEERVKNTVTLFDRYVPVFCRLCRVLCGVIRSAGLTCCVWDCGCTETLELQHEGTDGNQVNQTLSGRQPAGSASFLRCLLRTLKQNKNLIKQTIQVMLKCFTAGIIIFWKQKKSVK